MNRFRKLFADKRAFFPVIHCIDAARVRENIAIAESCGADGAFLINQGGMRTDEILALGETLRTSTSLPSLGINLLWHTSIGSLRAAKKHGFGALWTDNAGVDEGAEVAARELTELRDEREHLQWEGIHFGGVAFKGQREVPHHELDTQAVMAALGGVDVVTTSGPRTGSPPKLPKIRLISKALGAHPLAIASGITPDNIDSYLPYARAFLVATGIEAEFGRLDPARTMALAKRIHAFVEP